ncbi:MAG: pilus assembly protein [Chloroflexi bacterium]|nr:MAG: pilus assembly protein [Chloroflexota bacterium]
MAVGLVAAFLGVLVLVSIVVVVILLTMSNQIGNVFSNVAAALASSPSP